MMGRNICEHMRLDEADIKFFCEKPNPVKCSQCTLLLSVISDGIYICLSCGRQACKNHVVKNDDCDCSLFHKINTNKIWCLKCKIERTPKFGDYLFERYQTECVHLQRDYFATAPQMIKFRIAPFVQKCHKCTDLPDERFFICLECGKKTCCIEEAKIHNRCNFYHYLSLDISTKLLHCLNCQKQFNLDEVERYVYLKQQLKDALSYNKTSPPTKPLPLNNTGNICYFIVIVQNLRNCTQLKKCYASLISGNCFKQNYVICEETIEVDCEVKPVTAAVWKVLNADNQRELQLCMQDLMNLIRQKNKRFSMGTQQDSHEALRQIFDELREEEISNVKSKIRSKFETGTGEKSSEKENDSQLKDYLHQAVKIQTVVDKVFGGKTVNTVICRECLNVLQIVEPQLDFSLPLSDNISMSENQPENKPASSFAENQLELRNYLKNHNFYHQYLDEDYPVKPFTIEHCLQSFTMLDILDENNKFVCDKCVSTKDECLCSKQLLIHSLPPVLILHLKRFHLYPKVAKNNTHIKFPIVLNMAPFCTDKCFELSFSGKVDNTKSKILYALKGVVVHKGSLQFGHYYTFLRTTEKLPTDYQHDTYYDESSNIEGDWYCANDNNITRVANVQCGLPANVAKSPGYLLFYERLSL